jgi:hypothetical protein
VLIDVAGFCLNCKGHLSDAPNLRCPWCQEAKPLPEVAGATDPVGMLVDVRREKELAVQRGIALNRKRRELARRIKADPELYAAALKAGFRRESLDRWSAPKAPAACKLGHLRSEHGEFRGVRWVCLKCKADKVPPPPTKKQYAETRAFWRAHDKMMAEREKLAEAGELPANLREPFRPPALQSENR